jgi:subfamily B ATP-binding cassette protein HlyB/CyaB
VAHGLHVDGRLALQQFPPPFTLESLAAAACEMGLLARLQRFRPEDPPARNCLVALGPSTRPIDSSSRDGQGTAALSEPLDISLGLFEASTRLVRELGKNAPPGVPLAGMVDRLLGVAVCVDRAAAASETDPDAAPGTGFGFRWFVSEIARYRRVWGEVLTASLVIQILALIVPLITQTKRSARCGFWAWRSDWLSCFPAR